MNVENMTDKPALYSLLFGIIFMLVGGLFFGAGSLMLNKIQEGFDGLDCDNEEVAVVCDAIDLVFLAPLTALNGILVNISYLFIFLLILGMLMVGYNSGSSPKNIGFLIAGVFGVTYISIILSNIYYDLLTEPLFMEMMSEFVLFNKIILNFPWFTFIIGIISVMLSVVNYQRASVNSSSMGNY